MSKLLPLIILEFVLIPLFVVAPVVQIPYVRPVVEQTFESPKEWALETGLIESGSLSDRIVFCESKWREWECNNGFNCRAGIGLWQLVVSTWNETIVRMSKDDAYLPERCWQLMSHPISYEKREIIFDGECNLRVGLWLLEEDGTGHWGTEETDWGSYNCWNKSYVNNI